MSKAHDGSDHDVEETAVARLYDTAIGRAGAADLSEEEQAEIKEHLAEIHSPPDTTDPDNFDGHLSRVIHEEHKETPPEERRNVLCGCGNPICNLRDGERPPELCTPRRAVVDRKITKQDAREYLQRHTSAHVVRAAIERWDDARGDTEERLFAIMSLAGSSAVVGDKIDPENLPNVENGDGESGPDKASINTSDI